MGTFQKRTHLPFGSPDGLETRKFGGIGCCDTTLTDIVRAILKWKIEYYPLFISSMFYLQCFLEPLKKLQVDGYLMFVEPQDLFGNLDELCYVSKEL